MAVNEKLLHISIFGINLAVLIGLMMVPDFDEASSDTFLISCKRYSMRYLTNWTFGMIFTYNTCMVLVHILNLISVNSKLSYKLRRFADAILTIIVIPAGMFITIGFWIFYNIDRDLIFPKWMEEYVPSWVNHGVHTFNLVLPLADLLLVKHEFSSWSETIHYSALYIGSYIICLFGTYFHTGLWLYPIFTMMTLLQSFCTCLAVYMTVLIFHYIARLIGTRWGMSTVKSHQNEKNHYLKKVS